MEANVIRLCKADVLHRGQSGGRPGCDALTPVFMEELKNEISHASRKSLINFDNDAASCYDRIILALVSLIGRIHGIHHNVVFVNASTLKEAKYKLKTLRGVSDKFYQNCTAYPIYGTGQGSANSPVIWLIVSSTPSTCHEQYAYGATLTTPDKSLSVALSMVAFVDDSTGQVNDFTAEPQPSPEVLNKFMQYNAQLWSDLLWLSGGLLELPKCSYHHPHFTFEADGRPNIMGGQVGPSLVLTSSQDGSTVHIPQKSAFAPHKTLGHWKAPVGNGSKQLQVLREKSQAMASQLLRSPIRNYEAWRFYGAIYLKAIGYVLPNCHFTETQLQLLQSIMYRVILPKCESNWKTARKIIHGPSELCGGQFLPLYTMQGEGQIMQFLKFWCTKTDTGKLLRAAVAWLQLHIGVGFSLLDNVTTVIPHLATCWLPSLRTFLASINGTIQLEQTYVPPIQRVHDEYIMDTMANSFNTSTNPTRSLLKVGPLSGYHTRTRFLSMRPCFLERTSGMSSISFQHQYQVLYRTYLRHFRNMWTQDLFSQLEMWSGCYTILDLIDQYPVVPSSGSPDQFQRQLSSLIAVSDGLSMDGNMTFGWTMSLPNGQRIASCAGQPLTQKICPSGQRRTECCRWSVSSSNYFPFVMLTKPVRYNCQLTTNLCSNISQSTNNTKPISLRQRQTQIGT
jgi:hypothetical protein